MSLCTFKNSLGKPGHGIHSIRIANIAIVDLIATIILAKLYQIFFHKLFPYPYWFWVLITILSGILLHRIFCVNTTINKLIFGEI